MVGRYLGRCLCGVLALLILHAGGMLAVGGESDNPLAGKRIVIDAGHGGIDSGASYYGIAEKSINLLLARSVGEKLTASGADVSYTRTEDVDYYTRGKGGKRADLKRRVMMIEDAKADVFISIHCNAAANTTYRGVQVFYHPRRAENRRLAELMQAELVKLGEGKKRQAAENTHVLLLSSLSTVGVLVEAGYLSNEDEARLLADESYREQLAEGIIRSLFIYFAEKSA